jgi:hypothetical protein
VISCRKRIVFRFHRETSLRSGDDVELRLKLPVLLSVPCVAGRGALISQATWQRRANYEPAVTETFPTNL